MRNFVSLRIYAKPQDTNYGRLPSYGDVSLQFYYNFKCWEGFVYWKEKS